MRLLIALVVWAAAIFGAVALSSSVAHTVHNEQRRAATTTTTAGKPTPNFQPDSVKPTDPRSMFVGANFARALAHVRSHVGPHADVISVEVFPGQVETTVEQQNAEVSAIARADGEYLSSSDSNGGGSTQVFSLSQVSANVPSSLARRLAAHGHVPVADLHFMQVRIDTLHHLFHWYVYPKQDNLYFQADTAHGPIQEFNHGRPGRVIRG